MPNLLSGHRPDITPAQVIGFSAAAVGPICILFGVHLSPQQLGAIDDLRVAGLGLFAADLGLRGVRNHHDAKVKVAALQSGTVPPDAATAATDPDLPSDEEEFAPGAGPDGEGAESAVTPDAPDAP